jgi:hypothetical protein
VRYDIYMSLGGKGLTRFGPLYLHKWPKRVVEDRGVYSVRNVQSGDKTDVDTATTLRGEGITFTSPHSVTPQKFEIVANSHCSKFSSYFKHFSQFTSYGVKWEFGQKLSLS